MKMTKKIMQDNTLFDDKEAQIPFEMVNKAEIKEKKIDDIEKTELSPNTRERKSVPKLGKRNETSNKN